MFNKNVVKFFPIDFTVALDKSSNTNMPLEIVSILVSILDLNGNTSLKSILFKSDIVLISLVDNSLYKLLIV